MSGRLTRIGALVALTLPLLGAKNCGVNPVESTITVPEEQIPPLRTASLEELLGKIEERATGVVTINAVTELAPTTGSAYSGVIEQYRDVRAFVLARRIPLEVTVNDEPQPVSSARTVRLMGQAPVVRKNIFDMVADENRFRIFLPTKNQFIVGPTRLNKRSEKPIENLRPQHLFEALFLEPARADARHLLEENEFGGIRYYAVSEILPGEAGALALHRKWWFDRRGLELVRVQYFDEQGRLLSDIHYADWRDEGAAPYPWEIKLGRPYEDYQLKLIVKELALNEPLPLAAFDLEQPDKIEVIDLDEEEARQALTEPEDEVP